uniref:Uncharacterized protein n=1 Tax=Stapleton virus TaxID=2600331 RepID=A0A5B8XB35_9VIRU|nr:hypothetical protein 4 [Stapleton virus]
MGRLFRNHDWHGFFVKTPVEMSRAITSVHGSVSSLSQTNVPGRPNTAFTPKVSVDFNRGSGLGILTGVGLWMPTTDVDLVPEVGPIQGTHEIPVTVEYKGEGEGKTKTIGGGGDVRGDVRYTFDLTFPLEVHQALGLEGVFVTLSVVTSQADYGVVELTNNQNYDNVYSVTVDWSKFLDYAVPLATTKLVSSSYAKGLILQAWGIVKPNIPKLQTTVQVAFTWVTNTNETRYRDFRFNNVVDLVLTGGKEMLRLTPPSVDLGIYVADLD